ncbi:hypothetical protein GOODEAATRI_001770 [Goodea atripinnis]|uniref:Uncharacterized protein n=1 Tax=Goodea atripinnis TaxID=208336 RepID=A0ABV0NR16_9TELE
MSLSFGSSAVPDPESAASSAGNESASSIKAAEESSDSNATSAPDLLSPRAFYVGPHFHLGEKSAGFSKPQLISSPGGFHSSSNPWFGPPLFQKAVYTSTDSDPYTYGDDSMRFPYYSNDGVHAAALPYGYSYGTARSPYYSYSYGTGGSPQAYDRRVPIAPPYGVGPPPAYGYFSQQPSILDPELLLIGNILMRVRAITKQETSYLTASMLKMIWSLFLNLKRWRHNNSLLQKLGFSGHTLFFVKLPVANHLLLHLSLRDECYHPLPLPQTACIDDFLALSVQNKKLQHPQQTAPLLTGHLLYHQLFNRDYPAHLLQGRTPALHTRSKHHLHQPHQRYRSGQGRTAVMNLQVHGCSVMLVRSSAQSLHPCLRPSHVQFPNHLKHGHLPEPLFFQVIGGVKGGSLCLYKDHDPSYDAASQTEGQV